jgi:hypothetical protein
MSRKQVASLDRADTADVKASSSSDVRLRLKPELMIATEVEDQG